MQYPCLHHKPKIFHGWLWCPFSEISTADSTSPHYMVISSLQSGHQKTKQCPCLQESIQSTYGHSFLWILAPTWSQIPLNLNAREIAHYQVPCHFSHKPLLWLATVAWSNPCHKNMSKHWIINPHRIGYCIHFFCTLKMISLPCYPNNAALLSSLSKSELLSPSSKDSNYITVIAMGFEQIP